MRARGPLDLTKFRDDDCATLVGLLDSFAASMPTTEQHVQALDMVDWALENAAEDKLPSLVTLTTSQRVNVLGILEEILDMCSEEYSVVDDLICKVNAWRGS
jgi:hypothetical protein